MKRTTNLFLCVAMACLIPALAYAAFPVGQWKWTTYSENGKGRSTEGLCFEEDGTWYSDTYEEGLSGRWFLSGNDVHIRGNYSDGNGNTTFELNRIHDTLITGYFMEWRDDNTFSNRGTAKLNFEKETCNPPAVRQQGGTSMNPTAAR